MYWTNFRKSVQAEAKEYLCKIPYSETKAECEHLRDKFRKVFGNIYPKALKMLERDWDRMVTFFPNFLKSIGGT